jgi:hypothetical protein
VTHKAYVADVANHAATYASYRSESSCDRCGVLHSARAESHH